MITFAIHHLRHGTDGTRLTASLPKALGNWGNLTGIEMTLSRRYSYKGRLRSFINAGCPAPKGVSVASFPLARTSFAFAGGQTLTSVLTRSCGVRHLRLSRRPRSQCDDRGRVPGAGWGPGDALNARTEMRAAAALSLANARYWSTVLPRVQRQVRRWESRARLISDPTLRALATSKLELERFNIEAAATQATLAPRRHRARAIEAIVALQVAYDYLDGLSEQPAPDPLGNSRRLFSAFGAALSVEPVAPIDHYRSHPHREDGGYLQALVATCQSAFGGLPRSGAVAPVAREAMLRCGEGQSRTHAVAALGGAQLEDWATAQAQGTDLSWWEYTAGATASVIVAHALIAAAADARTSAAQAKDLDRAYVYICILSTLLDSLIDHRRDVEEGSHSFIAYYPSEAAKAEGVGEIAARAVAGTNGLRNGSHHRMTAAGVAAYYLSAPEANRPPASVVKARVAGELRPLITPILGIFGLWRLAKHLAASRR